MGRTQATHLDHELELKIDNSKPYTCDGCKEKGNGRRYRCEKCDIDLHKACAFIMPTTSHGFYPRSSFKFFDQPPKLENVSDCIRFCNACRRRVHGFVYHCKENDVDLHPCCHDLNNELDIEGVKFQLLGTVRKECMLCNRISIPNSPSRIKGWSYISECETYHFHVSCAAEVEANGFKDLGNQEEYMAFDNLEEHREAENLIVRRNWPRTAAKISWKTVKLFFNILISALLGDPASIAIDLAQEFFGG